jgi:hypothetical protein
LSRMVRMWPHGKCHRLWDIWIEGWPSLSETAHVLQVRP